MGGNAVKAIRDWCRSMFQQKGEYLTSVPEGYVTNEALEQKGYLTEDGVPAITNNLLATEAGTALDAVQGKVLDGKITKLKNDLLNSGILSDLLRSTDINDNFTFDDLVEKQTVTFFTNWTDSVNFPIQYASGVMIPAKDSRNRYMLYMGSNGFYYGYYSFTLGMKWTKIVD